MPVLARLLRRRRPVPPPAYDPQDPSLEVCLTAFRPERADSEVLAEAAARGVDVSAPLLVRHHLAGLPGQDAVAQARRVLEADGWDVVAAAGAGHRPLAVLACRTERLTALSASRERSRMAGLAQRLGGQAVGYDALRPRPTSPRSAHGSGGRRP